MTDFNMSDFFEPDEHEFLYDPLPDPVSEPIVPCFITGVSHERLYRTSKRIAKITCDGRIYRIFIDQKNNGAVLVVPDMHCDIWFPSGMTIRDVIYEYFGERLILTNESLYMPMSHATFCNITL